MARHCIFTVTLLLGLSLAAPRTPAAEPATFRFYQGVTAYVDNPDGKAFDIAVDVRDWNLMENGPREMLFKVYDPDGRLLERKVIEDDGVSGDAFQPEAGGWDHEMWYHLLNYARGSVPMIAWSSLTEPSRVKRLEARRFGLSVEGGTKGVYRVLLMGSRDHVATLAVSKGLKFGLAGHPMWMHGNGDMFERAYVYVPKGTIGLNLGFAEYDQPVTRRFTVTAPDGEVLWDGPATGGFRSRKIKLDPPQKYDDQVLTVEVAAGKGDYMLHMLLDRNDVRKYRGWGGSPAVYAPDPETATRLRGGAIYHDNQVFWHGFQVRFHDWLKANISDDDCVVRDAAGQVIEPSAGPKYGWNTVSKVYKGLPKAKTPFVPLNGVHEAPPVCDTLMHDYVAHENPSVRNLALRDLHEGLRMLTVGDVPVINRWSGNLGYVFGTYGWHYWRPAWRLRRLSDAPAEIKDIIREAMILAGDRLAFARGIERTNGNAMSHIPMALRYAWEATEDPVQQALADTYLERFANGGWGRGAGISPSGDCQEHFGHDFHYGTYIHANYRAVIADLDDERFEKIRNRIADLYAYLFCPEANGYPWNARTAQPASLGRSRWKGQPGDDFTVNVHDGNEWFAARRPTYYALTFHGRLAPEWLNHYFGTKMGYGGGILCQLSVPGYGVVIASTLSGKYGQGMQRHNWRKFHIHSLVGTMIDGEPFVGADSEHLDARLVDNVVTGGGEVRYRPVHVERSYRFNDDSIVCEAALSDTIYRAGYQGRGAPSALSELYEMIPFLPGKKGNATSVTAYDHEGKAIGPVTKELQSATAVVFDRGGYGVQAVFPVPYPVRLGVTDTVLVQLADERIKAEEARLTYTLVPYVGPPVIGKGAIVRQEHPLPRLDAIAALDQVADRLANVDPMTVAAGGGDVARVRLAVTGDHLAIDAEVNDKKVAQVDPPWNGSSVELFATAPGGKDIAQVFLLPAAGEKPAIGLKAANPKPVRADGIRVQTTKRKGGYRLLALIPLTDLAIAPDQEQVMLEVQVGAVAKRKREHATLFGSRRAYEDTVRYGLFAIGDAEED